jgi:hypothetical protein
MWRLFNLIFGWDYIAWHNYADRGISRVRVNLEGKVWFYRYKNTEWIDEIEEPGEVKRKGTFIFWLTCSPEKYLGERK